MGWRTGPDHLPKKETAAGVEAAAGTAIGTGAATDLVLLLQILVTRGKEMTEGTGETEIIEGTEETGGIGALGLSSGELEIGNAKAARLITLPPEICASVVQSLAGMGEVAEGTGTGTEMIEEAIGTGMIVTVIVDATEVTEGATVEEEVPLPSKLETGTAIVAEPIILQTRRHASAVGYQNREELSNDMT